MREIDFREEKAEERMVKAKGKEGAKQAHGNYVEMQSQSKANALVTEKRPSQPATATEKGEMV